MKKRRPLVIDDALIAELAGPKPDGVHCSDFVTQIRKRLEADGWTPNNLALSAIVAAVLEGLRDR